MAFTTKLPHVLPNTLGLTQSSGTTHDVSATLAGTGTITATAFVIRSLVATTLNGTSTLFCAVLPEHYVSATLNGTSTLTASISNDHGSGPVTLAGSGTCTATAFVIRNIVVTLAGTGTCSATAVDVSGSDSFYEVSATIGGVTVLLVQRLNSNQYLDGTNDWPIPSPMNQHREAPSMLGYNYSYITEWLDDGNRFRYPADNTPWTKFVLWDVVTDLVQESTFTGTLSSKTFRNSTMSTVDLKQINGVYTPVVVVATGWEGDGKTNVAILGAGEFESTIDVGCSASVAINGVKVKQTGWEGDGKTNCAWASSLYGTTGWEGDGATDCEFSYEPILPISGSTDCQFTPFLYVGGRFEGDGATVVEFTAHQVYAGFFSWNGETNCEITAAQVYAGFFSWNGETNCEITAAQEYAGFIFMQGVGTCNIQPFVMHYDSFECDGATDVEFTERSLIQGFFECDGTTNVSWIGEYLPIVEIVCTGVGDLFINGLKGIFQGFTANGETIVSITANAKYEGFLQWYTGIGTNVSFLPYREISDRFECDGDTSMTINSAQNVDGTAIFLTDSSLSLIGSFEYDGTVTFTGGTLMVNNSHYYPLGAEYLWGIISNQTETGSPDFVPIFSGSFTISGVTSTSQGGPTLLGRMNVKNAFGFNRAMDNLLYQPAQEFTRQEWVRFPFFVTEAVDVTQISDTVAFTLDGITSQGGDGWLGEDKEEYVLFSVLTHALLTQETMEILAAGNPSVHVTQVNYEMLWIPASFVHCTQTVTEILYLANLGAIQQAAVETLAGGDGGECLLQQAAIEAIYSIKAYVLMTQMTLEALQGPDNPNVRMTQTVMEVLSLNQIAQFAAANIQQVAVAALHNDNPNAFIQAIAIEQIGNNLGFARIQQAVVEALGNGNSNARLQQVAIAELNNSTTMAGCIQQIAVEMLVKPEFDGTVGSLVNNPHYHQ